MAGAAGKDGKFLIGTTEYPITDFSLDHTCAALEDSNTKSGGKEEYVAGFTVCTGTLTAYYDSADNPIPALNPSSTATGIFNIDGTKTITIPLLVTGMNFSMPVKDKVTFNVSFTSTGYDMATQLDAL